MKKPEQTVRGVSYRRAGCFASMAVHIVKHYDIAKRRRQKQGLLDIGLRCFAIGRVVKRDRRGNPTVTHRRNFG